jgi:DNA replication regulator SLD3
MFLAGILANNNLGSFSARLPTVCDSINRKLGGPVIAPPSRSKSRSKQPVKRDTKPGSATKRTPISILSAPPTLQRALSTEQQHRRSVSRGPSNMIALMRSATSTAIPSFKREGSESVASRATPGAETRESQSRDGLPRSISMTNVEDARAKKKAMVEAELKDAISALRKPNRDVVGKALVEAAERRISTGSSAKKVRKPIRPSASAIQVKATPANKRFRDVLGASVKVLASPILADMEEIIPPSSIGTLISSTAPRRGYWDTAPRSASPSKDTIASTPVKQSKFSDIPQQLTNMESEIPLSSPVMCRNGVTPIRPPFKERDDNMGPLRRLNFAASRSSMVYEEKASRSMLENECTTASDNREPVEASRTIYQQLGWDDELDDLL